MPIPTVHAHKNKLHMVFGMFSNFSTDRSIFEYKKKKKNQQLQFYK